MAPKKAKAPDYDSGSLDPVTKLVEPDAEIAVVHITGEDGRDRYAWRKDGVKPVINLEDFARNIHSALDGKPGADFADHVGPA